MSKLTTWPERIWMDENGTSIKGRGTEFIRADIVQQSAARIESLNEKCKELDAERLNALGIIRRHGIGNCTEKIKKLEAELAALKSTPVDERAAFEAWCESNGGQPTRTSYSVWSAAWQARAALPQQTRELSDERILELVCDNTGKRINLCNFTLDELNTFARAIEREIRGGK